MANAIYDRSGANLSTDNSVCSAHFLLNVYLNEVVSKLPPLYLIESLNTTLLDDGRFNEGDSR